MPTQVIHSYRLILDFFRAYLIIAYGISTISRRIQFFFHHTTCESTCDTLSSSTANQGDNTVSVAQGGTATPGATMQLLPSGI